MDKFHAHNAFGSHVVSKKGLLSKCHQIYEVKMQNLIQYEDEKSF